MKFKASLFLILLSFSFIFNSCGSTVKYSTDVDRNNYSNLVTGRKYSFKINDGSRQKMVYTRVTKDEIIGFKNKKDSTIVSIPKASVTEARDSNKSTVEAIAIGVGVAGAAAIAVSASRATAD